MGSHGYMDHLVIGQEPLTMVTGTNEQLLEEKDLSASNCNIVGKYDDVHYEIRCLLSGLNLWAWTGFDVLILVPTSRLK